MNKQETLAICLAKVEEKFQQKERALWTHKTYVALADEISKHSSIYISPSSLKRLFGKISYNYFPQIQTRNALSIYVGFKNWEEFSGQYEVYEPKNEKRLRVLVGIALLLAIVLALGFWVKINFPFNIQPSLTVGKAPLFVSFKYNYPIIKNKKYTISFDDFSDKKTMELSPKDSLINYTFLHSDVYHVTIKEGKDIVKIIPIVSTSDKWESLICSWKEKEGYCENLYASEDITKNGALYVGSKTISNYGFDTTDNIWIKHRLITEIDVESDAFIFESRMRNITSRNFFDCPGINITILGLDHRIKFQLSSPGCISADKPIFEFSDQILSSESTDFSNFETDLEIWRNLKVEVVDDILAFSIDSTEIFRTTLNISVGKIYGLIVDVKGTGEIDFVRFKDLNQQIKFEDNFD